MTALAICAVTAAAEKIRGPQPILPHHPDQDPPPDPGLIALTVAELKRLSGRTGAPCQDCSWGFPRPARRTRRATLTAPGAPRVLPVGQPLAAAAGFGVHGVGILLPR